MGVVKMGLCSPVLDVKPNTSHPVTLQSLL